MRWLGWALTTWLLASSAASAQEWRVLAVDAPARAFAGGEWTTLATGGATPAAALLHAEAGGRIRIGRGDDVLDLAGPGEMRVESDALARVFSGAEGVVERDAAGKTFAVVTPQASLAVKGAEFGVAVEATQTTVVVQSGLVIATDFFTRHAVELRAGQTYRARFGHAGEAIGPAKADAAAAAAREAASRATSSSADAASSGLDRAATGALSGGAAKGDPKLAEDAAGAAHRERARLGKADPRAAAAAQSIEQDLMQGFDVETEPLASDFRWTEVVNGQLRLKPLWRVIYDLDGAEKFEFWALASLICLILGGMTNAILGSVGFGSVLNAVVVLAAFTTAVLVRDLFFRSGANIAIEPFMSLGMMLGAMPTMLLGGAVAKSRLDL